MFHRFNSQTHLLGQGSADESAYRVVLPVSSLDNLSRSGTLFAAQEFEHTLLLRAIFRFARSFRLRALGRLYLLRFLSCHRLLFRLSWFACRDFCSHRRFLSAHHRACTFITPVREESEWKDRRIHDKR